MDAWDARKFVMLVQEDRERDINTYLSNKQGRRTHVPLTYACEDPTFQLAR